MISSATAHKARMRLMTHYVKRITELDAIYRQGGENSLYAIEVIRTERDQLEQCRTWLTKHADTDVEVAQLVVKLAIVGDSYLDDYLSNMDILSWLELVLQVARRLDDPRAIVKLTRAVAANHFELGNPEVAKQWLLPAIEMAEFHNYLEEVADCLALFASISDDAGNMRLAQDYQQRALAIYRDLGDKPGTAMILRHLGWSCMREGVWDLAEQYYNESYAIYLRLGNPRSIAKLLQTWGVLALNIGKYAESLSLRTQALEIALSTGDQGNATIIMMDIASSHDTLGNFAAAKEMYLKVLHVSKVQGFRRLTAAAYGNLGYSAYLQGDYVDAVRYSELALIELREQSQLLMVCMGLANIIPAYLPLGQYEQAEQALQEGLQIALDSDVEILKTTMVVATVQTWVAMVQVESDANARMSLLENATLWAGVVMANPASLQENRDEIAKLLPFIEAQLGGEKMNRFMQDGASLVIDEVITEILRSMDVAQA